MLLYKIIQWWYDTDAAGIEAPWICGHTLTCRTRESVRLSYDPDTGRLWVSVSPDFGELVWPRGVGLNRPAVALYPLWLDPAYAASADVAPCNASDGSPTGLCLAGIDPDQARQWMAMAAHLELELTGTVCGLNDDRIALFLGSDLHRTCPLDRALAEQSSSPTLTLRCRSTARVLAILVIRADPDRR